MTYQHILVAVDLSEDSQVLVTKGAALARTLNAKLSLIHIDTNYAELYTGLIDINMAEAQYRMADHAQEQLEALAKQAEYPVTHTYVGSGDLSDEICNTIKESDIDLMICGHHQDFWSKILSSTKQLINHTPVDLLMVPLH
ncbi:universal stress protein [Photobacterium sp. 1_MG-2023]|uniref:universal stress protein n=1 Tax=Photobacterium sp. 1_MG-2023 TaxID=3062646 RepID=UPI0026E21F74|nr:universal stress protein [Photobacterium sp. 1_MG-2023]MDO6707446.1 universal stress protein [Photobacterium sp. 1_MG-2023]